MATVDVVLVLTTAPDAARANTWARTLVEERVAACANVHAPMTSIYRWKGKGEQDVECQLVLKTVRDRIETVRRRLAELHSYELPEVLVLEVAEGSDEYLRWVAGETQS